MIYITLSYAHWEYKLASFSLSLLQESPKSGSAVANASQKQKEKITHCQKNSPSPLRQIKPEMNRSANSASDPNLNQNCKLSPNLGFRPRSSTFSFTNRYRMKRRRISLGVGTGDNKMSSITHSTQLTFLDFVDLFKAFGLRCRKDLKDLFEQFAMTPKPNDKDIPLNKAQSYIPPSNDTCKELHVALKTMSKTQFILSSKNFSLSVIFNIHLNFQSLKA